MRIIKLVWLSLKDIWRNKWGYGILIFEFILIECLLLYMGSRLQGIVESDAVRNAFNGEKMYYYAQHDYCTKELTDILSSEVLEQIEIVSIPEMVLTETKGDEYVACGYSERIMQACRYQLEEGKWFDEYDGRYIPVISASHEIKSGQKIQIATNGQPAILEVIGRLQEDDYILYFHGGASNGNGSLEQFVSRAVCDLIVPYGCSGIASIEDEEITYLDDGTKRMIFLENDMTAEKFLKQCRDYGFVSSVKQMQDNFEEKTKNEIIVNSIVLGVFILLSITGLVCFQAMQASINEKRYLCYYFLGGTNKDFVFIEILKNVITIGVAYVSFLLAYKRMKIFRFSGSGLNSISTGTIFGVFMVITVICIMPSLCYMKRIAKREWIYAYKMKA